MAQTGHTICMDFQVLTKLVRNVLEDAKRELAKPVVKKEPVTPEMISSIRNRLAGPNANLSDLHFAAICVTAYSAFLRYNELASPCLLYTSPSPRDA